MKPWDPGRAEPMLEARNVFKNYGAFEALTDISVELRPGEILGIIGPNGAGKTTFLESVAGLLPIDSGAIEWQSKALPVARRKEKLFYMPDGARPFGEQTGRALIALFVGLYGVEAGRVDGLITKLSFMPVLDKRIDTLSKGTLKRLLLALALLTPQPVLLLDEPFDGLDPHQVRVVMELLRETRDRGRSLVLSIHQLTDAERICDRVLLLCAGRVVGLGTIDELRGRAKVTGGLEEIFFAFT